MRNKTRLQKREGIFFTAVLSEKKTKATEIPIRKEKDGNRQEKRVIPRLHDGCRVA